MGKTVLILRQGQGLYLLWGRILNYVMSRNDSKCKSIFLFPNEFSTTRVNAQSSAGSLLMVSNMCWYMYICMQTQMESCMAFYWEMGQAGTWDWKLVKIGDANGFIGGPKSNHAKPAPNIQTVWKAKWVLSLPLSVSPSIRKLYIVHMITSNKFGLKSPNLHRTCILGYSQRVSKMAVIDLDL